MESDLSADRSQSTLSPAVDVAANRQSTKHTAAASSLEVTETSCLQEDAASVASSYLSGYVSCSVSSSETRVDVSAASTDETANGPSQETTEVQASAESLPNGDVRRRMESAMVSEQSSAEYQATYAPSQTSMPSEQRPSSTAADSSDLTTESSDLVPESPVTSSSSTPGTGSSTHTRVQSDDIADPSQRPSVSAAEAADPVDRDTGFVHVSPPPAAVGLTEHHVKWVQFHGARSPVVTQNENGPCPLLALVNVMLLKGKLQLPDRLPVVTSGQLLDRVGDTIIDTVPDQLPELAQLNYQQNVQDAMSCVPKLQTGLDVNVKFTSVSEFEYTPECAIFDLLNVRLYHGWLVDPAVRECRLAVGTCGYNQLVENIINNKQSDDPQLAHQALIAEDFLESTAAQLTEYGLQELTREMSEGEMAVFFRNNHFSTIYKYNGTLYVLVTDQGFLRESRVVWETLTSTAGAGQFVDGQFEPLQTTDDFCPAPSSPLVEPRSQLQIDQDYMVALSLQEENTRQQAQELQWEEYKHAEFGNTELSDAELARRLQEEEERGVEEEQLQSPPAEDNSSSSSRSQQQPTTTAAGGRSPHSSTAATSSSRRADGRKKSCSIM